MRKGVVMAAKTNPTGIHAVAKMDTSTKRYLNCLYITNINTESHLVCNRWSLFY